MKAFCLVDLPKLHFNCVFFRNFLKKSINLNFSELKSYEKALKNLGSFKPLKLSTKDEIKREKLYHQKQPPRSHFGMGVLL